MEECKEITRPTPECQLYMVLQIDTVKDLINKNHSLLDKKMELMLQRQEVQDQNYKELSTHVFGNGKLGIKQLATEWEAHKVQHKEVSNKGWKITCILFQIIMVLCLGYIARKVFTIPFHHNEEQTEQIQHDQIYHSTNDVGAFTCQNTQ